MIPTHIPRIPTLIPRIPIILTQIPCIPISPLIPFPNSPFRIFQISIFPLHFPKLKFIFDSKLNLVL